MPTIISKLGSIQCPGVFNSWRADGDLAEFQKKNLIYGFNGSGKTTLSRVFASLGNGQLDDQLDPTCKFSVKLADPVSMVTQEDLATLAGRLLVYNGDFVARNFRWATGEAEPVFYLGKTQTDTSKELESAKVSREQTSTKLAAAKTLRDSHKRTLDTFKTETARTISTATRPSTQYRSNNLDTDFAAASYDQSHTLTDERYDALASLVGQTQARAKVPAEVQDLSTDLKKVLADLTLLLSQTPGGLVLDDLAAHDTMIGWAKTGLDYHSKHKLDACLFCGQAITRERLDQLALFMDDKLGQLLANIDAHISGIADLQTSARDLKAKVPRREQFDSTVQTAYESTHTEITRLIDAVIGHLVNLSAVLGEKKQSPTKPNSVDKAVTQSIDVWHADWQRECAAYKEAAEKHNDLQDRFEHQKADARKHLRSHHLAQAQARYQELAAAAADAGTTHDKLEVELRNAATTIQTLEEKLRDHGPAADRINPMIASFLGHSEIAIETAATGYKLIRKSGADLGQLSEGEKTAITVCYFLTLIEADGRKASDLIVVIDDPISSLDTRALNYAFNLLKARLGDVAQLFILTHNLHFMNEAKKWIKPSRKDQAAGVEPALFFLDTKQSGNAGSRQSNVIKMPALLREYESEYQFMFSIVRSAVTSDSYSEHHFLLPNAMRKVLEVFIAFKVPGSSGLTSSLESKPIRECGIDHVRLKALERLAHVESHGDSLDDLVTLSPMTIEESKEAAVILFELIEKLDPHHYSSMCGLCR